MSHLESDSWYHRWPRQPRWPQAWAFVKLWSLQSTIPYASRRTSRIVKCMLSSGDTCPTLGLFSQLIKRKPSGLPFSSHQLFRLKETGFGALGKDLGKSSWIWAQMIVPVECGWRCGWASGESKSPLWIVKGLWRLGNTRGDIFCSSCASPTQRVAKITPRRVTFPRCPIQRASVAMGGAQTLSRNIAVDLLFLIKAMVTEGWK